MDADTQRVLDVMTAIVQEFGENHVYEPNGGATGACRYVETDGKLGCLVGRVLHRLGASIEQLALNDIPPKTVYQPNFIKPIPLSTQAWAVLAEAQGAQDAGRPWGVALKTAKDAVHLYK